MWFTGRVSGAATVFVVEPSQVTGLAEAAGAFVAGVRAADAVAPPEDPAPEESVPADGALPSEEPEGADELEAVVGEGAADEGLVLDPLPSSWVPVPSLHALSESVARTAVAAAATRRVREVRRLDMEWRPFGVRVAVVIG
jgi:hypothetical protein